MNIKDIYGSITGICERDINELKMIFHCPENTDIIFRKIVACGRKMYAIYLDGMADAVKIDDFILRALQGNDTVVEMNVMSYIMENVLQTSSVKTVSEYRKIV